LNVNDFSRIGSYINGEADETEKAWAEALFLDGEDNSTLRNLLEKDWDSMRIGHSLPEEKRDRLLDKIHHHIRKNENREKRSILSRFTRIYMKAAAILLLPLLIAGALVYSYLGPHTVTTDKLKAGSSIYAPMGARVSFNLPDGTTGMLNSGSSLSYSMPFSDNRQVVLEGEAWFEVTSDTEHPFEISAGSSSVKVLGTSFNMSAYPEEDYIEVVLLNGSVEFKYNQASDKMLMFPSERLIFRDGSISKSVTDPLKYASWTEGKLVFRGDPMAEVARRIERWYNVKVNIADKELEKYSFRAIFLDDTLEDVLRYISMTSPIRYSIVPPVLLQDGTFTKQEVTIYLKK
jgi:transmembrane sensor